MNVNGFKNNIAFNANVIKNIYNSEDFSIYACNVDDAKRKGIAINKYGNTNIFGNIHELSIGTEYMVTATPENTKYGVGYKVFNITRNNDDNKGNSNYRDFLEEFITYNQANSLLSVYPDIVDRIMNDRLKDIDLNKINGIKEKTFNVIKTKVIENFKLAELVTEFKNVFSISIIRKLYETYTSIEQVRYLLSNNPYKCLTSIGRVGFVTADTLLLEVEKQGLITYNFDLLTSTQRMSSCTYYVLEENEKNGNTYMDIKEFKDKCVQLAPECMNKLIDIFKDEKSGIHFNKDKMCISLMRAYQTETSISTIIKNAILEPRIWQCEIEQYRKMNEIMLTDDQLTLLDKVCKNNIVVLNGFSGSGKTSSTRALVKYLNESKKSFKIACPTGRAAQVISEYTSQPAQTIHRLLGFKPPNIWTYAKDNQFDVDLILIDETSMCDIYMFLNLISAINFTKTKLVLVGDSFQLPSVGAGNVFHDLIMSNIVPKVELTKVFRYGEGGITTVATDTRMSKPYIPSNTKSPLAFGINKDYTFIPVSKEKTIQFTERLYKKLLDEGSVPQDIMVTTAYNKGDLGTDALNKALQNIANPLIEGLDSIKYGSTEFRLNDVVMNIINDYEPDIVNIFDINLSKDDMMVTNGEIGKIVRIKNKSIVIKFGIKLIEYGIEKFKMLKLAYAIGTFKSQGGQAENVIVISPSAHSYMLSSNLLYVAITRARDKVYHIGDARAINRAILKKDNYDRKSFLSYLLKNS